MRGRAVKAEEGGKATREMIKEKHLASLERERPSAKARRMFRHKPYGSMDETIDQAGK